MTAQETKGAAIGQPVPMLPESAPFAPAQRAWLNGFFAGLLSVQAEPGATAHQGALPAAATLALEDDDAPWHDPSMAIADRMKLADGKPVKKKLFAAMAQQDCGQCGYLCDTYAAALASGAETKVNLCAPGGKETSRMVKQLIEEAGADGGPGSQAVDPAAHETPPPASSAAVPGYSRAAPVEAIFRSAQRITHATSEKDARHVVFDISQSGIDYVPGDRFGLMPSNDPALVEAVLAAMRAPGDFPITGGTTFRDALTYDYCLGAAPDMLFELVSYMVGGERRQKAKALAKGQDPYGDADQYDVLAVLERFGPLHPDPEAFLECLEPLQPRLYSISSSPLATPGELHLTVDAVRYDIGDRKRLGVASTCLADRLTPGAPVKVYVQKAHGFALPPAPQTPIIMVGPGTGIAPFRSFLWHRNAMAAKGEPIGKSWLFFGHQREATDFFYRDELDGLVANGTLSALTTAWSRDGTAKVYVQDKMRACGPELWSWLQAGAHFYVCGDAKRMAKDVETALTDIAANHGGLDASAAKAFIGKLKSDGRYQADVY